MRVLFNVLWHLPCLGFISAALIYFLGLLLTATVVAAPIGLGLMEYGKFLFAPCTRVMVKESEVSSKKPGSVWRIWSAIVRILYFPFGLMLFFISVIQIALSIVLIFGIFNAYVMAKSLGTYFNPVGKMCLPYLVAEEAERQKAREILENMKS